MYAPALGGAESHLQRVATGLARRGHEVTVFTADTRNSWELWQGKAAGLPREEVLDGVRVRRLVPSGGTAGKLLDAWQRLPGGYRSGRLIFGEEGLELLVRKPRLAELVPQLLAAQAEIVVSFNWYWPPAYHVYLARKLKRFTLVGIPLFHLAKDWCYRNVYRRMLAACDAVVANTEYEAAFARQQAGVRAEVGGVGVDTDMFARRDGRAIRERHRLGEAPVVGFVGRQAANKGAGTLIRAMRLVWRTRPDVRLLLAGPRPPVERELDPLMASLEPAERERIVSIDHFADEEKASIYDAMDIFVLPSTGESFGIAYLEAWMCEKAVIGARIGPTQCVIEEGQDGLLVSPKDPEDTARAILELLSDRVRRQSMGRRGHAKTLERHTWEKVNDRVERLFRDLISGHTAPKAGYATVGVR